MGIEFAFIAQDQLRMKAVDSLHQQQPNPKFEDWPILPEVWLLSAIGRMSADERDLMLRHKLIAYAWHPAGVIYCAVDNQAMREGLKRGLQLEGRTEAAFYRKLVRRCFSNNLEQMAVHLLARRNPAVSAHRRLSGPQMAVAVIALVICAVLAVTLSVLQFVTLMQMMAFVFFAIVVGLRCLCLMPALQRHHVKSQPLSNDVLPVYTVLVPLFREISVLDQLVHSLSLLDYPRGKLDIKIILEESDRPMQLAVRSLHLPSYFDVIIVPRGRPQTKPRALNYAIQFARGSLVTIYDGEDIPQPNQLRLAAAAFAEADDNLGCLQASLAFFNPNENWLARQFTAEYAALFRVLLPTLEAYDLPLPLGGTSNHFRASALQAVGYWDAFNMTEDADLGIRLARHGFKTGMLDSTTFEEANTELANWLLQRRRWLKGFLQTWLVHNRNPLRLLHDVGFGGFLAVQAMTIGIFASALLHPVLLFTALWSFLPGPLAASTATPFGAFISGASLVILLLGYVTAIATSKAGLKQEGVVGWTSVLAGIPVYWLLMTAAAWLALKDFLIAPFHWHKTRHGLTRVGNNCKLGR